MQRPADSPAGYDFSRQEIIEVKLWEVYLTYDRHSLYRTLTAYSLDNGPVEKDQQEEGRVCFRFLAFDWERSIRQLLFDHRIPVIVQTVRSPGVLTRDRREVLAKY